MISRIIKVEVRVISRRPRLITLTSTLIILDITKTSSNNCLLYGDYSAARQTLVLFWRLSTFSVANDYMELKAAFNCRMKKKLLREILVGVINPNTLILVSLRLKTGV